MKVGGGAQVLLGDGMFFGGTQGPAEPLKSFGGCQGWPVYICWADTARLTAQAQNKNNIKVLLFIKAYACLLIEDSIVEKRDCCKAFLRVV